jgi:hypothetical protein
MLYTIFIVIISFLAFLIGVALCYADYKAGGWKMIYANFFPVTCEQDMNFKNGGKDVVRVSFTKKDITVGVYFRGTKREYESFFGRKMGSNMLIECV